MKSYTYRLALIAISAAASTSVVAGGSAEASARALEHSLQAIGYSLESGFKLVSGAAAVPLTISGEIGHVSGEMGAEMWDIANAPPGEPFPISDEVVTSQPAMPAEEQQ